MFVHQTWDSMNSTMETARLVRDSLLRVHGAIYTAFQALDTNADGVLSLSELSTVRMVLCGCAMKCAATT